MDFSHLVCTLNQATFSLVQTGIDDGERERLYQACEKLTTCLETPVERLLKASSGFIPPAVIRVAVDIGVFNLFNDDGKENTHEFDLSEIASRTNTDPSLICRLMRFLVTLELFEVRPNGRIGATSFTRCFQPGHEVHDYIMLVSGLYIPLFGRLPEYFRQNHRQTPALANTGRGLFQDALNTNLHFYDWLRHHRPEQDAFHRIMAATARADTSIWTHYISDEWVFKHLPQDRNAFTMVDVGGSSGHVLEAFMQRFPGIHGRFILQDLSEVMPEEVSVRSQSTGDKTGRIERMRHDFFQPQPVRGANVYVLARILHNWPDQEARTILGNIRAVMDNKSTLLVQDCVFLDQPTKVSYMDVVCDLSMMVSLGSLERSEGQFRDLLRSAGLRLVKIWREQSASDSTQAVLEIVRED